MHGVPPPEELVEFTAQQESVYAAIINIGAVIGAFLGAILSDKVGRRRTLAGTAMPHLIAWVGTGYTKNWIALCALRLLLGIGVGVGSAVTPTYISEIATVGLRGSLGAANQLSVTMGIFLTNMVGTYVFTVEKDSEFFCEWTHVSLFGAALGCILLPVAFLPESPCWLAKAGDREAVLRCLRKLRAADSDIATEAAGMLVASQASGSASASSNSRSLLKYKKSLVIGMGLLCFQQAGGVNAVIMYTSDICSKAGVQNANAAAMASMFAQVLFTAMSVALMERAGRRVLLLFACTCMTLSHAVLAYYFYAQSHDLWAPSAVALVALVVFIFGFSLGMGPIPWLLMPEIMPTEVRGKASSFGTAINWGTSFLVTLCFQPLQNMIKIEGVFLLFCGVMFVCLVFVAMKVPETKGKSVEEVLEILDGSVGDRRSFGVEARDVNVLANKPAAVHPGVTAS